MKNCSQSVRELREKRAWWQEQLAGIADVSLRTIAVVGAADAYQFDQDELSSEEDVELVADFLQDLQDYGEIWDDIGAADHVRAMHQFTKRIETLNAAELWVFALRNKQEWVPGNPKTELDVATVFVGRASNPRIVAVRTTQPAMPSSQ